MIAFPNFRTTEDRLPPQNIETEEAILGGILLDPEAMGRVADILVPEAFSIEAHEILYRAAKTLYGQAKPTDLMSVTSWLHDRKQLEKVGGTNKLALLVDRTVSALNIEQYAEIVTDKYLRRKFIEVGHSFIKHGYESIGSLSSLFKWAGERVEELSHSVPDNREDADTIRYNKCIEAVRDIELLITDPGLKAWKLKKIAGQYDCTPRQLEEIYYRSLLSAENEPLMSWDELISNYGESSREWLIHGLIPSGTTILLHADGNVGKTRLAYDLIHHVVNGASWGDFPVQQAKCLLVQTDESVHDMKQH